MGKCKEFFIVFMDTEKRDPNAYVEGTRKTEVENLLRSIHYNLLLKNGTAGNLTCK